MTSLSYLRRTTLLVVFLALTTAVGSAQLVTAYNGTADNLSNSTSYRIYVDDGFKTQVAPMPHGNENAFAIKFIVTANPGTNVTVSFTLPTLLSGPGGTIACTFDSGTGVFLEETHKRWNPNAPEMLNIGASGDATIHLGMVLSIPVSVDTGLFSATVIVHVDTAAISAQYTIRVTNMTTEVSDERGAVVKQYILDQNYPNPFNPSTQINFSLQSSQYVLLKVYDALGREIAVLMNERKAPGVYEVPFSADNLVSGTYYYRLQAGRYSETRKMVFLR